MLQSEASKRRLKHNYFDNNATTALHQTTKETCISWFDSGNASSIKTYAGQEANKLIDTTRKYIIQHNNLSSGKFIFTSGASESNTTIIECLAVSALQNCQKRKHNAPIIITSTIEHKSILMKCEQLERLGLIILDKVPVQLDGIINPSIISQTIKKYKNKNKKILLVTIIHANNETGAINDIKTIGEICKNERVPFHSDVTQTFGKIIIDPEFFNLDSFSMSFHKMHGLKGVGGLFVRDILNLCPLINGMQQFELRGGTENIIGISSVLPAITQTFINRSKKNKQMEELIQYIIKKLQNITQIIIFGPTNFEKRLPNTLLVSLNYNNQKMCNTKLLQYLDSKEITISIGSACNTSSKLASHVLYAMNVPKEYLKGVIRISLSEFTTKKECDYLLHHINIFIKDRINKI
jgi:cysteine desulfurase